MTCSASESYNIDGKNYSVPGASTDNMYTPSLDVCAVNKLLARLHADFTGKYTGGSSSSPCSGNECVGNNNNDQNPSYYLRNQPTSNTDETEVNRFYENSTNSSSNSGAYKGREYYRKMVSVIMKGDNTNNFAESDYDKAPDSITELTDFSSPDRFKGIYGMNRVIDILEKKINIVLVGLTPSESSGSSSGDDVKKFGERKEIKNTLEEIAYRENQIYREKFLNVCLVVVGIFLVGSQLAQKYFSGGGGAGGGGAGLGGLFGFGVGGSGGLFSRFGGLGLGSSGRGRIGNLFTKSSYSLEQK